jgi:hypothetical protein
MRIIGRLASALCMIVIALLGSQPSASAADSPCPGCQVNPDPAELAYHGALLLPPGTDSGLSTTAAHCDGCDWLVKPNCRDTSGSGDSLCSGAVGGCPAGDLWMELWLRRPTWVGYIAVGAFCLAPGQPLTPVALIPGVRDEFERMLPPLLPSYQPAGRGIVNLPVIFTSGQPPSLPRRTFKLASFAIDLEARTTWRWEFGDGATLETTAPGGTYPDTSVTHTYLWSQTSAVRVTALWSGEFWVDGAGPFDVTGPPLTQAVDMTLPVKEARALLVGGS